VTMPPKLSSDSRATLAACQICTLSIPTQRIPLPSTYELSRHSVNATHRIQGDNDFEAARGRASDHNVFHHKDLADVPRLTFQATPYIAVKRMPHRFQLPKSISFSSW
jgi:hypothetical protein